jgi:alpha-galactosidase
VNRRAFLGAGAAALAPVGVALARAKPAALDLAAVRSAPTSVIPVDPKASVAGLHVERQWQGGRCRAQLVNRGREPVAVREVVLASLAHQLPDETALYGESFQMLSQTVGTLGKPVDLGYAEVKHYKIPQPADVTAVVTGLLTLRPPGGEAAALAFTSCRRFIGRFYLRPGKIDAVLDTEGLTLEPGQRWTLEELSVGQGPDRPALLAEVAGRLRENHKPLAWKRPPTGWCSWYCFGPRVTARDVLDNLEVIAKRVPALRYVQIDDGYQPAMGDWLETGKAFGGNVKGVLAQIRERGFEPAIWVAPFVAEAGSHLFQQHPDWFIKDGSNAPLSSNKVTFGGWRRGPWYALDGTHPEVQKHFETLFSTMRREWGCTYFKLDANFWGALHGGRLHDPAATRIEAYRRGMQAILKGAGDSFILGCNHPLWPSLGLIHGSRSSGDIKRSWAVFQRTGRQNLSRAWQNGQLWWNDPDAVVLTGDLTDDEFQLHATVVYASGGMILSGDDLTKIPAPRLAMLEKLLPPTGSAAAFEDESLRVGMVSRPDGSRAYCLFNWGDDHDTVIIKLPGPVEVTDFWTGQSLGRQKGTLTIPDMAPHSARLLVCKPSKDKGRGA